MTLRRIGIILSLAALLIMATGCGVSVSVSGEVNITTAATGEENTEGTLPATEEGTTESSGLDLPEDDLDDVTETTGSNGETATTEAESSTSTAAAAQEPTSDTEGQTEEGQTEGETTEGETTEGGTTADRTTTGSENITLPSVEGWTGATNEKGEIVLPIIPLN